MLSYYNANLLDEFFKKQSAPDDDTKTAFYFITI